MSVQLLDKTRKINKLLHNSSSSKVVFNDICQVLMDTLSSNILVLSKKGKVLGISLCPGVDEITELIEDKVGGHVDSLLNERFLGVLSTKAYPVYSFNASVHSLPVFVGAPVAVIVVPVESMTISNVAAAVVGIMS